MESRAKATWSLTQLNNQTQPTKNCGALNRCAQVQKTEAMATSANWSTAIPKLFPIVTLSILCLFWFGSSLTFHLFERVCFLCLSSASKWCEPHWPWPRLRGQDGNDCVALSFVLPFDLVGFTVDLVLSA
jgi:hypothetical protein